jgi:spermidine synthase
MSTTAVAVALLAAATLAFEILLVRVFAIEHFHHIAYMAIGVAMLGIGASGTLVAVAGGATVRGAQDWFPTVSLCTAASLIAAPALLHRVPLDLTQLTWSPEQWLRLGAVYLILAIPFALGALAILLAITLDRTHPGQIYGASFLGSGIGAVVAVAVLWLMHPTRALAVPALLAAFGGGLAAVRGTRRITQLLIAIATSVLAFLVISHPLWSVRVSPYKGLPQVEAYPEASRVAERSSPLGWVVAVHTPAFRHAPGLSLGYTGEFPPQTALFVDGEIAGAVTYWGTDITDSSATEILRWLPTALPYALGGRERVLVLGAGGGMDVWTAVSHGARRIDAVELNSALIAVATDLEPLPTRETTGAEINWIVGDARTVTARSHERFDLITLAPGGGITGAAGGLHALNEDFLHTTDAYEQYLRRLTSGGVVAITDWVTVPPRGSLRMVLTAVEALRRVRPSAVANGIVVARSWGTVTVLMKPSGFVVTDLDRLGKWADSRQVDLDWYPGAVAPQAQYNIPSEPTLARVARAAVTDPDGARNFAASYPFVVAPVSDARPYPHRFLRAESVRAFLGRRSAGWLPFAEWGYIALIATLVQSALLAGLIIILPVVLRSGRRSGGNNSLLPLIFYFSAIGVGYMAAEIAVIQQLTLLLGHPVYAVAGVLATILVCSGVGSALSDRYDPSRVRTIGLVLTCCLLLLAVVLLDVVHLLLPAPLLTRGAVAAAVVMPVALVMGTMFPLGLRTIAREDNAQIAWAWGANGFASVVAVPVAALIAVETGSRMLLAVAAIAYFGAALLARRQVTNP